MAKCIECGDKYLARECPNCANSDFNNPTNKAEVKIMCDDVRTAMYVFIGEMVLFLIASILDYAVKGNNEDFAIFLIYLGVVSLIPYKISNGSNFTRYLYLIFFVLTTVYSVVTGEIWSSTPAEHYYERISILFGVMDVYIIFKLFTPESNKWFSKAFK